MSKKWLKVALMVTAIATGTSIQVDAETVLYVPQVYNIQLIPLRLRV